jgi:type III pantothenate kinase
MRAMSDRILTVDLGNTRCKLVLWQPAPAPAAGWKPSDERDLPTSQVLSQHHFESLLARWIPPDVDVARAALCGVAAQSVEDAIERTLQRCFEDRFTPDLDAGLENECREPARVGRDRLFAARGAWELVHEGAVVVDAGTALTVDALAPGSASTRPRFLGGAIAAGPRILADALARNAARLPLVDPAPGTRALGRDTAGALQSGIVVGFRGAAAELQRSIASESGLSGAPVVVTGGARAFLLEPTPCFDARVVVDHLLVHRGLLHALLAPQ